MPVFWGDGRNYAGNRLYKSGPDGLTLYLRHGQIAVAMDVELYNPASTEGKTTKAKISRYVLSGDLIAGRVQQTIPWTGQAVSAKSYYHLDHLNSTKLITKEDGTAEVQYVYRAFGEQLRKLGSGDATYTYGGKELDDNTNLYYFNARFYDATTGRFINVDPIQDGTNWYVYCSNNPLNFKDPTGLGDEKVAPNPPPTKNARVDLEPLSDGLEAGGTAVAATGLALDLKANNLNHPSKTLVEANGKAFWSAANNSQLGTPGGKLLQTAMTSEANAGFTQINNMRSTGYALGTAAKGLTYLGVAITLSDAAYHYYNGDVDGGNKSLVSGGAGLAAGGVVTSGIIGAVAIFGGPVGWGITAVALVAGGVAGVYTSTTINNNWGK